MHSIFNRDHPGTADDNVIEAFADAILKLDDSVPTGTYVDMCSNLPVCDPEKITVPTIIMRGQWDGIASFADLTKFFEKLPNPDKQFAVMPGIAHASIQQKNYAIVYHILLSWFTQPDPVYTGHDTSHTRHGRARPGHPRLRLEALLKTWMPRDKRGHDAEE